MASSVNNDLRIPYEIGCFIASQVPYLDSSSSPVGPWAEHKPHFKSGPNPFHHQMKQGLILTVRNYIEKPESIYTRYGKWTVLCTSYGSFDKVFEVVKKTLDLKKIEEISNDNISYWAIRKWDGISLEEPISADEYKGEFIPSTQAREAFREFTAKL